MKVQNSAPLICEYPQGDSYFSHDRPPPDRILPATWECPIDLTDFKALDGGVKGHDRGLLVNDPGDPHSSTTRSAGYFLISGASASKTELHIDDIEYQGLTQSHMTYDTFIAEPFQNSSSSSTADLSVNHRTRKDATDHSLQQNQIVQADAEEIFSAPGNKGDDGYAMATNLVDTSTDIAEALASGLDSHLHEKKDEWHPRITESGWSSSRTGPEVLYNCSGNKQLDTVTILNPHLSQTSTNTPYTSTSSSARSRQSGSCGELRRPQRSRQRIAYDAPLYGFENVDISLSHYSVLNKVPSTIGHEPPELDNPSVLAQSHREHIWSIAYEDEFGGRSVGERGHERPRQARHKCVQRWAPPAPYQTTSYTVSPHFRHSRGYRSMDYELRELADTSSSTTSMHQRLFEARLRPRVIQVVPSQPRVSEAVFGPDSYDEAVANGTDQKRAPLTGWKKAERIVLQQWKNWLCVALLLSLAITVPVVLNKSHRQDPPSSVKDGDREGGKANGNTQTSTTVPRLNTSHHNTAATHKPSITTATATTAANSSSAAVKPSPTPAAATTGVPKS